MSASFTIAAEHIGPFSDIANKAVYRQRYASMAGVKFHRRSTEDLFQHIERSMLGMQSVKSALMAANFICNHRSWLTRLENGKESAGTIPIEIAGKLLQCRPAGFNINWHIHTAPNNTCHDKDCPYCNHRVVAYYLGKKLPAIHPYPEELIKHVRLLDIRFNAKTYEKAVEDLEEIEKKVKSSYRRFRKGIPCLLRRKIYRRTYDDGQRWEGFFDLMFFTNREVPSKIENHPVCATDTKTASRNLLSHFFRHIPVWASKEPQDLIQTMQCNWYTHQYQILYEK